MYSLPSKDHTCNMYSHFSDITYEFSIICCQVGMPKKCDCLSFKLQFVPADRALLRKQLRVQTQSPNIWRETTQISVSHLEKSELILAHPNNSVVVKFELPMYIYSKS
jgi:hypothetical protein